MTPTRTTCRKKKGRGLMYTSIAPKKKVKKKNQEKTKKEAGKGLKKDSIKKNARVSMKTIFLPSDIKSLRKQLFYLLAEYESGNKSLRSKIVAILKTLRRRNAMNENEYRIKLNSVYE